MPSAAEATASLSSRSELPPGPGFIATFDFVRNPFRFLDNCSRRYGEWFTVRVPGVSPFIFTSDPAAVREVFLGDPELLHAGEANRPLGAFMGEKSSLFLDGAAHLHERRLLLPAFHGERMRSYADTMCSAADKAIAKFPIDKPFAIHPWMRSITFDVIMRTVFGIDEGGRGSELRDLVTRLFEIYTGRAGTLFAMSAMRVDLGPWSPWGKAVRLQRQVDAILYAEFKYRRAEGVNGREDILSMLLEARDENGEPMSDRVLRDEMLTLMLAGHETTAATMAWIINRLVTRPDVMERARAEVLSVLDGAPISSQHVGSLKYLEAVINETMRLDPVIPNFGRALKAPMKIAGRDLPAGVMIAPCIYLVHRRPELWPNPDQFNPDRFIDARPSPYAFLPFGGGTRRCLGAAFASYQMKVVIADILSKVNLKPVPGYVARPLRRSIAFAPSEGLPVIASRLGN
ncbi:MAG: cytochrome P450 [Candidatus Binatus sp.]|uniref:cytochrome P450 n=1 Tax=Candidatus Binatus sp. TaxID=2811406 RepID=UPI00271E0A51|nr:cytochrome P450 [Candidatus Binatus sp.]MDO8434486.1 cytochrome P450 [Candidatus Binatus sp.]